MSDLQLSLPGLVSESFGSPGEWVWAADESEEEFVASEFVHATVMKDLVVEALAPKNGSVYIDATLGGGGHAEAILEAAPGAMIVAFDRDSAAIQASSERLVAYRDQVIFIQSPFGNLLEELRARSIKSVDGLCADLGVSSPQIDDAARGMSFRREGPLDMRMDANDGETALELIGRLSDEELADIIFRYGDERRSRRIARSIKRALDADELATTLDLRRAVVRAVGPARVGGVDPATRTFQALRIAVNDEIGQLRSLLEQLPDALAPGATAAIISFHSTEDRLVKQAFASRTMWQPRWKKPRVASDEEVSGNPRARSAKLRAAARLARDEG